MFARAINTCLAMAIVSLAVACSSDSTQNPVSPSPVGNLSITDVAASAATADAQGERRNGSAPPGGSGPRITATGNRNVINGGTLAVSISGDAPYNRIYMFVGGRTLGLVGEFEGGIEGHYEMRLPSTQTSSTVLVSFPQEMPLDQIDLQFAVASPSGAVGPYSTLSTTVTRVGTGDIQVTLSWNADSDTDLHVVAPGGEEVYYARRQVPSGGELDLDSNAACSIDGVRNENITWPVGRAPRGSYTVRVDYWSSCGVARTNFTVRVISGGSVQVVTGDFTGTGDRGGAGSGRTVATFERTSGVLAPAEAITPGGVWSFSKKLMMSQASGK